MASTKRPDADPAMAHRRRETDLLRELREAGSVDPEEPRRAEQPRPIEREPKRADQSKDG